MDRQNALDELETRAFAARISMSDLFARAGASSATLARWRKSPETMRASTLSKIEVTLSQIEGGSSDTEPGAQTGR